MKTLLLSSLFFLLINTCFAESPTDAIKNRIKPVGQVTISNDGAAPEATKTAAPAAPAPTQAKAANTGENIYNKHCVACHAAGIAGAPKKGVAAAWKERSKKGVKGLLASAIKGLNAMPPKGTCMECTDKDLEAAIIFMCPECNS